MEITIKEQPIRFSGPMVRAILAGKKTVDRRVIKPQPPADRMLGECCYSDTGWAEMDDPSTVQPAGCYCNDVPCPYGQPGDRLWVREAFHAYHWDKPRAVYRADGEPCRVRTQIESYEVGRWTPSIHMPRWASRITLEVKSVRVERLQAITEAEAIAEGFDMSKWKARRDFIYLWDQLNADRGYGWLSNPWLWRVEFERL